MEPTDQIFKTIIDKCRNSLNEYEPNLEKMLIYAGPFTQSELVKLRKNCAQKGWSLVAFGQNTTDVFLIDTQLGIIQEVFNQYMVQCVFFIKTKTFALNLEVLVNKNNPFINRDLTYVELQHKWNEFIVKYKQNILDLFDPSEIHTFCQKIKLAKLNKKEWIDGLKHVEIRN